MAANMVPFKSHNPEDLSGSRTRMEFHIEMPAAGSRDRFAALHRQIRAAIIDGRLAAGLRLPTTRELSARLGVSRNTVVAAYEQLVSEGYLLSRQRAGTFVAAAMPAAQRRGASPHDPPALAWAGLPDAWQKVTPWSTEAMSAGPRFDFRVGLPDHSQLPWDTWRRLCARAQRDFARAPRAYTDPAGDPLLREAIAAHVSLSRAVACSAADVLITSGAQHAFALLADVLVTPQATVVAVEDPGYAPLHAAMAFRGAQLQRVPLDHEGLRVDRLPPQAKVICVTPSHQFPVGTAMSPGPPLAAARTCAATPGDRDRGRLRRRIPLRRASARRPPFARRPRPGVSTSAPFRR